MSEIECDPLTIPRVSCRLWKSHSSKSSNGLVAPIAAKIRKNNNLLIVREQKPKDKGKMRYLEVKSNDKDRGQFKATVH